MSEVPFLDSGADYSSLSSINEDDLLRYFLNDDFEQSPFDSKVPSDLLLDPPTISLPPSPLPTKLPQPSPQTTTIQVKKEPTTNTKANSTKAKSTKPVSSLPIVKSSVNVITPVSLPLATQITPKPFSNTLTTIGPKPNNNIPKSVAPIIPATQQIHPITVTINNSSTSNTTDTISKGPFSPLSLSSSTTSSPSSSPAPSPLASPVPEDDKTMKRQRRLLKNRESAQLSRIRKKMYIDELERKVNALVSENTGLREEVVHLNDVIKQATNSEGEINTKALSKTEVGRAVTHTDTSNNNHHHAKRYAGVCLLVVLFSLGLFLNVASPSQTRHSPRLIEFDGKNNNGTNNNNEYGDYKLVKPTDSNTIGRKRQAEDDQLEMPNREWVDVEYALPPSPKRNRMDYYESDSSPMIEEVTTNIEDEDDIFDVLEDDAFDDESMLTTSSLSSSSLSSPSSSSPSSPALSLVPASPSVPSRPASPLSLSPLSSFSLSPSSLINEPSSSGLAVLMPPSDEPVRMVHVHFWTLLQ